MTSFKEKHIWRVLEAYFKENSIVKNQIDSFNHFIDFGLQEIVEQESDLIIQNYSIHFENIYIEKPQVIESDRSLKALYPHDCRLRELNYDASIYCDFTEIYIDGGKKEEKTHYRVSIGRMPIMLLSNYCNLSQIPKEKRPLKGECVNDPGGYFIIKGNERVLVGQMRAVYNQPFVLKSKKPGEKYVVEARSISDETGHSVLVQGILTSEDHILLSLPYIKSPVPCGVVFKAMGFLEEEEIIQFLSFDSEKSRRYIRNIIRDSFFCDTVEKAQEYISKFAMHIITDKRGKEYAKQIVETEILPHMGISGTTKEQACFLGRMIKKLVMTSLGERAEDDRDNYTNKRVDNAGSLMYDIFRNLFKKFKQTIKDNLESKKHKVDIISLISRTRLISQGLHKCLATGNWGVQKNATYMKTGVSQILDRMTYLSSLSHLRRLVIPVGKEGKNTAMRQLHSSSFGFVCPCECFSPETLILTWEGIVKRADEIVVGDILIDENGNPTRVKSTCSGFNTMYEIKHDKKGFDDYTVTENHILTLKSTVTGKIIDISISDYIKLDENIKHYYETFKCLNINRGYNELQKRLNLINILFQKHGYNIPCSKDDVSEIYVLCMSSGFFCIKTEEGVIVLNNKESFPYSSFTLHEKPLSPFVGFQLEGSGRFLLGDFTVSHNTPEGQKIGIVLNYSLTTKITCRGSKVENRKVLEKAKTILKTEEAKDLSDLAFVFLNGNVIGFSKDPEDTVNEIKKMRQKGILDSEVSVSYDIIDNDIKIFCDEGRFTRPLFVLENNTLKIKGEDKYKWKNLVKEDIVRYVDASEIEQSVIAMNGDVLKIQENDFCEIHPMLMLGIMASMIPFPDHSQSPRNCYQSSMGKQALGVPVLSYNIRTDTLLHVLHYPQKPLVYTKASELLHINDMPSGINAIVAIACYSGFNQEDSVMLNLSSIQRGLFSLTSYHTIDCMEKKRDTYSFEDIRLPPENSGPEVKESDPKFFRRKKANYSLLDENGIIKPRENGNTGNATKVKKGDVIVGKVVVIGNKSGSEKLEDQSIIIQPGEEGTIDRVYTTITPNGYKLVKVVIRVNRIPELGDKFASRAAQKGTLGMVYRQEDMPYTASGIVPDIIINPLCLAGESEICLEGGSVETIENIVKTTGSTVKTVDPESFSESYTGIHSPFKITPTRPMVRVKTWSGREIVCTDDHMVLTDSNVWKQAKELVPNKDMLTIVHTIKKLENIGEIPELKISETQLYYSILKDFVITESKLQILARLLGAIETDGHLEIRNRFSKSIRAVLNVGEKKDCEDIEKDVLKLGFRKPSYRQVSTKMNGEIYMNTFRVELPPSLGYVLYKLGAHPGRKSSSEKVFPEWLTKASKEVKRQFLSGIQGGDGSYLSVNTKTVQQQVRIKPTKMTCRVSVEKYHMEYMKGIVNLFRDLGISSTIRNTQPKDKLSREIGVAVSCRNGNLERYSDYIYYAYSNHKEIRSRIGIEFLRLRNRGIKIPYEKMAEFWNGDCISVYVDSVKSEPLHQFVYDFATKADTHSFIANSIVVHNCIPSRMTINQLIECVLGKEACFTKKGYGDATPFTKASENVATKLVDRIRDTLPNYGFSPHGWERMYNGMTGEMMEANIFIGPTYYQRLKHMVNDKMHARAKGHVTILTRQPLEGRARDGGFRFGEMERDCMIGHGCARFTKERLHDVSDPFQIPVCKNCKVITNTPKECQICKTDKVYYCTFPYASKLLHQELTSMGLKIKIKPDTITNE